MYERLQEDGLLGHGQALVGFCVIVDVSMAGLHTDPGKRGAGGCQGITRATVKSQYLAHLSSTPEMKLSVVQRPDPNAHALRDGSVSADGGVGL